MSVVAIDPGLRKTGIVRVEHGVITAAHTVRGRGGPSFAEVAETALTVATDIWRAMEVMWPLEIVCETFVDQGGRRHFSDRWKTPLVIGALVALAPRGMSITWQDAVEVLDAKRGYGDLYAMWRGAHRGLVRGDRLLSDEHQASAACHALWREAILCAPARAQGA